MVSRCVCGVRDFLFIESEGRSCLERQRRVYKAASSRGAITFFRGTLSLRNTSMTQQHIRYYIYRSSLRFCCPRSSLALWEKILQCIVVYGIEL